MENEKKLFGFDINDPVNGKSHVNVNYSEVNGNKITFISYSGYLLKLKSGEDRNKYILMWTKRAVSEALRKIHEKQINNINSKIKFLTSESLKIKLDIQDERGNSEINIHRKKILFFHSLIEIINGYAASINDIEERIEYISSAVEAKVYELLGNIQDNSFEDINTLTLK